MLFLPENLKSLIYIFDPTYKEIYNKVIDEFTIYATQWYVCKKNYIKEFIEINKLDYELIDLFFKKKFNISHNEAKKQVSYHNQVFKSVCRIPFGEDEWWDYVRNVGELEECYISDFYKNNKLFEKLKNNNSRPLLS
tara:strand:- start:57 stop:467 length:411 start_codon:yes stop_codon:yes gene_type:complete